MSAVSVPEVQELDNRGRAERPSADGAPSGMDLTEIVRRAAAGDHSAWDRLVDRFASTVWAVARAHRLSAADAADVSQTTWLRLLQNLERIEQPERVGAWLATTARRESLRLLRLSGRDLPGGVELDLMAAPPPARSSEDRLMAPDIDRAVCELVEQLPPRSQMLLRLLSADSPLSYKEISESLDMPIGSIGPTRARALEQLRRLAVKAGLRPEDLFL